MVEEGSDKIQKFILDKISSVSQLEVLLLLRDKPGQYWTPSAVSLELRSNESFALAQLSELHAHNLVLQRSDTYGYESGALDALLDGVAKLYRERRVAVIGLIYNKPEHRIKGLADAFNFFTLYSDERDLRLTISFYLSTWCLCQTSRT